MAHRILRRLAAVSMFAFAPLAAAAAVPERPDGYVTDAAQVLSDPVERGMEAVAGELERKTGAQVAVVTIASLDGNDVADAAVRLFKAWGVGRAKQDDGALLLVAVQDRRARIEVGYGLEGIIPDARAGRMIEEALPHFRAGNHDAAIARTFLSIVNVIATDRGVKITGAAAPASQKRQASPLVLFLLAIVFGFLVIKNPWLLLLLLSGRGGGGGFGGGGGGGFGGFGGFGGGMSGGGGASRGW